MKNKLYKLFLVLFAIGFIVFQYFLNQSLSQTINQLKDENLEMIIELTPLTSTSYFRERNLGIIDDKVLLFSYQELLGDEFAIFFYSANCTISQEIEKYITKMLLRDGDIPISLYFVNVEENLTFNATDIDLPLTEGITADNFALFGTPSFLVFSHGKYSMRVGQNGFNSLFLKEDV